MATIRCKACGKVYVYEKEGCCPSCGAYNRPPKREWVNADGTVQHMTDAAYAKRKQVMGKVCFEEKECHEEKVCYEDQTRRGVRKTASHDDHADRAPKTRTSTGKTSHTVPQGTVRRSTTRKRVSPGRSFLGVVLAAVIAIVGSTNILDRIFDGGSNVEPEGPVAPAGEIGDMYVYDAAMGEPLTMDDGSIIAVSSWALDENAGTVTVKMAADLVENDHDFYLSLLCMDEDGDEIELSEFSSSWTSAQGLEVVFEALDYKGLQPFCLAVNEWAGEDFVASWYYDLR